VPAAALGALLGLAVLGALSPAAAQSAPPRAAADTSGGTTGGTTSAGTSGSSVGTTSGTVSGGTSVGTSTGSVEGTSAGIVGGTGDPTDPTAPTNLGLASATPTAVTLTWDPSTDDVGVTGYEVLFLTGDGFVELGEFPTNTATLTGLRPHSGYDFTVYAIDTDGNHSPTAPHVYVHTADVPATDCSVGYHLVSRWPLGTGQGEGFQAEITVPNPGTTPVSGWTLAFEFTDQYFGGMTVTGMWGGTYTETAEHLVTVTPAAYTSTIPAGGSVTIGLMGTERSTNLAPPYFTLNGTVCATAAD
jgi:mannan endo-1,4-beta-mannosidase